MSDQKIKRVKSRKRFVTIDSHSIQDSTLSWKATGLLSYMLTMPDDWEFYVSDLKNRKKDGRDSTASGLKELEKAGYLVKEKRRTDDGRFAGYDYLLYEEPQRLNRYGKPVNGKPENGKPVTTKDLIELNTNNTNKLKREENKKALSKKSINPKDSKEKKPKEKSCAKKEKVGIPSPDYPATFSQELITACEAYFEHRKQIGQPFSSKNAKQTKVLQTSAQVAEYGETKVIASFYEAITEGWKMNYVRKDNKTQKHGKQQTASKKGGKESLSIEELFNLIDEGGCQSGI